MRFDNIFDCMKPEVEAELLGCMETFQVRRYSQRERRTVPVEMKRMKVTLEKLVLYCKVDFPERSYMTGFLSDIRNREIYIYEDGNWAWSGLQQWSGVRAIQHRTICDIVKHCASAILKNVRPNEMFFFEHYKEEPKRCGVVKMNLIQFRLLCSEVFSDEDSLFIPRAHSDITVYETGSWEMEYDYLGAGRDGELKKLNGFVQRLIPYFFKGEVLWQSESERVDADTTAMDLLKKG